MLVQFVYRQKPFPERSELWLTASDIIADSEDDSLRLGLPNGTLVSFSRLRKDELEPHYGALVDSARIDNQSSTFIGGHQHYNVQLQIGTETYAGLMLLAGVHIGRQLIRRACWTSIQQQTQVTIAPNGVTVEQAVTLQSWIGVAFNTVALGWF